MKRIRAEREKNVTPRYINEIEFRPREENASFKGYSIFNCNPYAGNL